jgi:hypothetical protein
MQRWLPIVCSVLSLAALGVAITALIRPALGTPAAPVPPQAEPVAPPPGAEPLPPGAIDLACSPLLPKDLEHLGPHLHLQGVRFTLRGGDKRFWVRLAIERWSRGARAEVYGTSEIVTSQGLIEGSFSAPYQISWGSDEKIPVVGFLSAEGGTRRFDGRLGTGGSFPSRSPQCR